jgi:DNA polymerase elongation subunit (family B)
MQRPDSKEGPSGSAQSDSKAVPKPSLIRAFLEATPREPVRPPWYPRVPKTAPPGLLLDVEYDGQAMLAKVKLYDPNSLEVYEWFDSSGHHPYCYTDLSREVLSQEQKVVGHPGFLMLKDTSKFNLLRDQEQKLVTILTRDPLAIGGRRDSIREVLTREHAWEADIRYTHCYIMDRGLTPGLLYRVQNSALVPVPQEYSARDATRIKALFKESSQAFQLVTEYLPLFLSPAPYLPRVALDIEVESAASDRIPDPDSASLPVIAAAFADDAGAGLVCLLRRKSVDSTKQPQLPKQVTVQFFDDERQLLETIFSVVWRSPLLLTYNGDNFDLRYLVQRARKLGIAAADIPCHITGDARGTPEAHSLYGVHVDLYRFFHNRSIQVYAFRNQYREVRLEDVSQALLGEGKRELVEEIRHLSLAALAEYCWRDADLTIRLTQHDNDLVLNLILLLMRIAHSGMDDFTRSAVSNWIRSTLYFAHRQRNYLIPRQEEIASLKGEAATAAIIKGKKYMGAIVVEPKAGVHFDVTVLDFASLYPSLMKAYNLSYETVRCNHPDCKHNKVPGTPHWICTKREGLTNLIIGVIRDVRVEYFKPQSREASLSPAQRSWFSVVEQALKVFLNACLPYDQEVIVRRKDGCVEKRQIGSLEHDWGELEVLSIGREGSSFGRPVFVPISGFSRSGTAPTLRIVLDDGRALRCTANHTVPRLRSDAGGRKSESRSAPNPGFEIEEVFAGRLKVDDEILVADHIPLSSSPPERLFIPDLLDDLPIYVGMRRSIYKQHSYRRSQTTSNELIRTINGEFRYAKGQKIYKTKWTDLSDKARDTIRRASEVAMVAKIGVNSGRWHDIAVPLGKDFFSFMGWFLSEGTVERNRIFVAQSQDRHLENCERIRTLLARLRWPFVFYQGGHQFAIHSNILAAVVQRLCGRGARNKRIPVSLLNIERAEELLKSYFDGDGSYVNNGQRRYSTVSRGLASDLLVLLGAVGRHASLHLDRLYRIVETEGRHNRRRGVGLLSFNGTAPVRIRSVEVEPQRQSVFDLETGNGWFVSTNGIVVHNSYGVLGASHFPLYCAPAAESVTALGRHAITQTIAEAQKLGVDVLYGDTDSLFLSRPTSEQLRQLIEHSEKELKVELDVDKQYRYVALSSRKKNYLGVTVDGRVDIKGLTGKKRNTPAFLQEAFMQMVEILRQVQTSDDFAAAKDRILRLAREKLTMLERREFDVSDLAIRVMLTKPLDTYKKTTPQHVKAAKLLEETGRDVGSGDIIAFVKTVSGVKPVERATPSEIDIPKYKELVKSTFEQVLDALGIEWLDTMGMRRLDTFFG